MHGFDFPSRIHEATSEVNLRDRSEMSPSYCEIDHLINGYD